MAKPQAKAAAKEAMTGKALARARAIRTSARKLNLVAASIRGKLASTAMTQLTFEKRRIAQDVKKVLQAAISNAENNHALDVDKLYVAEAWVGRSFVMKRFHARGRGKSAGIEKPFSNLTIIVQERENVVADKKTEARKSTETGVKSKSSKAKSTKTAAQSAVAAGA